MNVLIIPSWYPSENNTLSGIFFLEQAEALARNCPDMNIGISTWGQNDERMLLWANTPLANIYKVTKKPKASQKRLSDNLVEFFTPAFTWTRKIAKGNMVGIDKANEQNLIQFQNMYGKVDILHAHVAHPGGYVAMKLAEKYHVPYIITEHMSPFPFKCFLNGKSLSDYVSKPLGKSELNIAVSRALQKKMLDYGFDSVVIPNLVKDDFFHVSFKEKENEVFTFFCLGRMVPQKGIDILLRAIAKLKTIVKVRLGGDGPCLDDYKVLAEKLGISANLTWLGQIDRESAVKEFQTCNAFVLSSRHESMGLVFAEALASGKPVITTRCGGPEDFVDQSNGYIVDPGDVHGLSIAMDTMVKEHGKFDRQIIIDQTKKYFSPQVVTSKIRDVYTMAIEGYRGK